MAVIVALVMALTLALAATAGRFFFSSMSVINNFIWPCASCLTWLLSVCLCVRNVCCCAVVVVVVILCNVMELLLACGGSVLLFDYVVCIA